MLVAARGRRRQKACGVLTLCSDPARRLPTRPDHRDRRPRKLANLPGWRGVAPVAWENPLAVRAAVNPEVAGSSPVEPATQIKHLGRGDEPRPLCLWR